MLSENITKKEAILNPASLIIENRKGAKQITTLKLILDRTASLVWLQPDGMSLYLEK